MQCITSNQSGQKKPFSKDQWNIGQFIIVCCCCYLLFYKIILKQAKYQIIVWHVSFGHFGYKINITY